MSYIRSHSQYTVPDFVTNSLRKWESEKMYLSSYDKLSESNVTYNLFNKLLFLNRHLL